MQYSGLSTAVYVQTHTDYVCPKGHEARYTAWNLPLMLARPDGTTLVPCMVCLFEMLEPIAMTKQHGGVS